MRPSYLLIFSLIWYASASPEKKQFECILKVNVDSGLDEGRVTVCELSDVSYDGSRRTEFTFVNLTSLKTTPSLLIKFINSNLQTIPSFIFNDLDTIEILNLKSVGLRNILSSSLINAKSLRMLQAHENVITKLGASVFAGAENLEILDLSSNLITNINFEAFTGLDKLTRLSLSNNKIAIIDEETFQPLKNLLWIWLDRNVIKIISMNHLINNNKLIGIYLNDNKVSAVSPYLFDYLPDLNYLFLAGNNCTSQNFISQKIQRNTNVKQHLSLCFKEYRTIVPDDEEKNRLNNVFEETDKVNTKCEEEKADLMKQIENSKAKVSENKGK